MSMLHVLACLALATVLIALLQPRSQLGHRAADYQVGHYRLGEKIGEGGMGVIYRAEHVALKRPVAIKLLAPQRTSQADIERFEREARLTHSLRHESTVAVYDVGHTREGLPYYAMELVDGLDLQALVERQGPLDPRRVTRLLLQLVKALRALHEAGLVHRDVKPANVMLCARSWADASATPAIKLLDFGLSVPLQDSGPMVPALLGTPLYLPPEAITSPEHIDPRSDVYSLGALGYFLLTGRPPFPGETLLEVCGHHVHSSPTPPSQHLDRPLPERLESLIVSCLAKRPEQRPACASLQAALLQLTQTAEDDRALCSHRRSTLARAQLLAA